MISIDIQAIRHAEPDSMRELELLFKTKVILLNLKPRNQEDKQNILTRIKETQSQIMERIINK